MTRTNRIYPIFIPHAGCPFQCVYCDQHRITSGPGRMDRSTAQELTSHCLNGLAAVEAVQAQAGDRRPMEVAFYGGTFTALPHEVLHTVLGAAKSLVDKGVVSGVRFSTRPDCVSREVCDLLEDYPVQTVELGVQSFDDEVLAKSRRGYDVRTVEQAAERVKSRGWTLGIQLMAGLPGDSPSKFLSSVKQAVSLQGELIRFYPVIVLEGTLLARWYREGLYKPLDLEEAVHWCVPAYDYLLQSGKPPIRMGLQTDAQWSEQGAVLAGPLHPSFGYLVRVHWWRQKIHEALQRWVVAGRERETLTVHVPERVVSEVVGPGRSNIHCWMRDHSFVSVKVTGHHPWAPPAPCNPLAPFYFSRRIDHL